MFAAWRYEENGLDAWMEQKLGPRWSKVARPVVITAMEIMLQLTIELAQRLFYRPNKRKEKIVVEDLRLKSQSLLKQTYIEACTQQFYADKYTGVKFDPKSTL